MKFGSVFLSYFWVSKWHPKILQWHPKFWKPRYGFALYCSKTIWGKHVSLQVAIATNGCNVIGLRYRPTHFTGVEIGSEKCEFGICTLSCAPPRLGVLLYCLRFVQCGVRNCESPCNKGGCRVRQQWQQVARFWLFGPHWSNCEKIQMMQCALFYRDLWKQKISTCCFPFVNIGTQARN